VAAADRKASGAVTAKVEDKKSAANTPDKLTLSKGSIQAKADEGRVAKERADRDAAARAAELAKNIKDLSKVAAANAAKPAASAPVAAAPAAKVAASSPAPSISVAAVTPAVVASAPAPVAAPAPVVSAPSAPASVPAIKPVVAAPAPEVPAEEPGMLDELLADPLVPAGAGGLLVLLGGFAFYRQRQRKKNSAQVDSSFLESRLQPDSFFGASGGQRIDTANEGPVSNSSMVYSASQLDAADDVDPVAEADVYLAYGRDLQAEEILKEAVRTNPNRLAIHTKLLEIYAKRRDAKGFEAAAMQAFKLTGGNSPEWARICEMGLSIDADNRLYQPGITSISEFGNLETAPVAAAGASFAQSTVSFANSTVPQSMHAEFAESKAVDLDLDLDFSLDETPASAISDVTGGKVTPVATEQTVKMESGPADDGMTLDFDVSDPMPLTAEPEPSPALPEISLSMDGLSMTDDDLTPRPDFAPTGTMSSIPPVAEPASEPNTGMLEFDMGSLSLDLDPPSEQPSEAPSLSGEDPLETKLALADEFVSIGDEDGARALIEEVIAEATGDMRAKAQRALANLS
jgi:pilus assembly protein FimV